MKFYTGIGSRRTPLLLVGELMLETARLLCARGWTLRTGGAKGADERFLSGCLLWEPALYELYLPRAGFSDQAPATLWEPTPAAYEIAARYHPAWRQLRPHVRALHARNVHEVLGRDCATPSRMLICWTPDGSLDGNGPDTGGTGQALRVVAGECRDVTEVINLRRPDHYDRIAAFADSTGQRFPRGIQSGQEPLF